jgi:hypothetical protein
VKVIGFVRGAELEPDRVAVTGPGSDEFALTRRPATAIPSTTAENVVAAAAKEIVN